MAGDYVADNAQRKRRKRHYSNPKMVKFSTQMKEQAVKLLDVEKWSLDFFSVQGHKSGKSSMIIESLYQWNSQCKHGNRGIDVPYKKMNIHFRYRKCSKKLGNKKIEEVLFTIGYRLKAA
jgi:IS30 family transposase